MATCVISAAATDLIPARVEVKKDDSERGLVLRAQQGDQEAFATLFQLHKKRVYSVCLQMTKDVADARRFDAGSVLASVSERKFFPWRFRVLHLALPHRCEYGVDEVTPPQSSAALVAR